jgi:hypothetical protein
MIFNISLKTIKQNYEKFKLGKLQIHHIESEFLCHQIINHILRECDITSKEQFNRYLKAVTKQFRQQWFDWVLRMEDLEPSNTKLGLLSWNARNPNYNLEAWMESQGVSVQDILKIDFDEKDFLVKYRLFCLNVAYTHNGDLNFKFELK